MTFAPGFLFNNTVARSGRRLEEEINFEKKDVAECGLDERRSLISLIVFTQRWRKVHRLDCVVRI